MQQLSFTRSRVVDSVCNDNLSVRSRKSPPAQCASGTVEQVAVLYFTFTSLRLTPPGWLLYFRLRFDPALLSAENSDRELAQFA